MNSTEIAERVIGFFADHKGFDDWWYDLSPDITRSIKADLADNLSWWIHREDNEAGIREDRTPLWKPDEVAKLKQFYGLVPNEQLAINLGKSPKAVQLKAWRMGYARPRS